MPDINEELLLETLKWATGEAVKKSQGLPSEWDQGEWGRKASCGTSCCIAGRVAITRGYSPTVFTPGDTEPQLIEDVADHLLGFDGMEFGLCNGCNTIHDLWEVAGGVTDGRIHAGSTSTVSTMFLPSTTGWWLSGTRSCGSWNAATLTRLPACSVAGREPLPDPGGGSLVSSVEPSGSLIRIHRTSRTPPQRSLRVTTGGVPPGGIPLARSN